MAGCHGKASGQNGFKLSLLGFEPTEDFEHLVKEGRGRRLFPASPDKSLLLLKPIGTVPHGGGTRMEVDTHSYRLMRRWILQGMPYGKDTDPTVARIEVFPQQRTMPQDGQQQLLVVAHYTDGSTEDVTSTVKFEPNNPEMAETSVTGLVKTLDLSGEVAVMARYQGQVAVFRASIPLGVPVESTPEPKGFVDELVFAKLKTLGVPPSEVCDDATFVRRAAVGHRRPLAHARRDRAVSGGSESRQTGSLGRYAIGQHRLRRLLCQQVERDSAEQAGATTRMPAARGSSTTGFATACTKTSRTTSLCDNC